MRQFLLADAAPGMTRDLTGADYHYLARVRRLTAGAQLTVMDRAGVRYAARVTAVGPASLRLVVGGRADADPAAGTGAAAGTGPATPAVSLTLTLIQALPRGTLMDRVVRQATELGARAIVPVVAARSQGPSRSGEALARRWARWQRIARQAAQQSGAAPPEVEHPLPLAAYLEARSPADLELVFEPGTEPLHRLLARWVPAAAAAAGVSGAVEPAAAVQAAVMPGAVEPAAAVQAAVMPAAHVSGAPVRGADLRGADLGGTDVRAAHVRCAVGPEGAFSPAELDLFAAHGFHLVGLDAPVLRVDTAVTAALAATRQLLAGVADRWPHAQPTPAQPT